MTDWKLIKPPETKLDWSSIKPPEEEELDWTTIEPPKVEPEFKLEKAPEVEKTLWDKVKTIFEAKPETQIAKAQVSYNISQKTGIPILEVEKNLPKITKDLGIRGIPTSEEFLTAMFAFPVTAGLIAHPLTTGIGVAKFMALTEAENFAISKLKKWDYKFGAGVGLKELLPEETSQLTKDVVDVADFIGKGLIIAKTDPKLMKIWKNFTQKISTEYTLPKNVYVSAEKVKSIFKTGEKISAEELQLITDLGLNASQYKSAIKKGIDIEISASKITTITDRPYWAKIKGLFNVKPITEIVVTRGGKVSPAKLMIEGKAKIPEVRVPKIPEVKAKVEPNIENDYRLIDKWIKANTPKVSVSGHGGLKEVSEQIRKGNVSTDVLEAMHRQFEKTKDQETGEMLWWNDVIDDPTAYPRTGTLMDFYNAYENLDLITKAPVKTVQGLAPKTKEEIYAEKYGIPLEKVKITELGKAEPVKGEKLGEQLEQLQKSEVIPEKIPEPTTKDLDLIEKGFTTLSRKEFIEKTQVPEKLVTPEGKGEPSYFVHPDIMRIPSMAEVQNIGTKLASVFSIEAPFIKAGAKETGFQVKNYFGNIGLAHEQGLKEIKTLNKINLEIPTVKESGFKASGKLDYTDLTYLSERPGYFVKLSPEEKKMMSPAKKSIKDFYSGWESKLKEIGWLGEPFPQSLITRNTRTIGNLKASLPRLKGEAKAKAQAEINNLQDQVDRIKKQKIQFVSIPAKAILAKADTDPILRAKIMSILPHWGRTTITVKDLVDSGIITRQDADIRNIIGEYSDRMGRKYALGKIFENAEKEGLIKSQAEKPDWPTARIFVKGEHVSVPQLRGKRLDPFFSDVVTSFFSKGQVGMGGVFGIIKMAQFYNPLFMPMYDVLQAAALGVFLNPVKGAEYIAKGVKDVFLKTDNWERASENATFSKPFVIPYDKFEYQFTEAMKDNKMGEFIKKAALPTNWIPMLYTASWRTAWKLDETVRMMSYNYLKDKGMTDREAGQMAALFHSDYASVPPATRKMLNKVFFTPTFKITMGKLYTNMLKGGVNVLKKGTKATTEDKLLARGALLALAGMTGISMFFASQGYEEVEKFRKYSKKVETDEGIKENVITLANPFNIPWRYYYRVKGAFKPQTTNVAEKMLQVVKWDLHPIWRVGADIVDNYNWNVYNPFDKDEKIASDVGLYAAGEFVKITKSLLESAKEGEIKADAFKAMQKDFGKIEAIVLKPFVFNYLREVEEKRKSWAMQKLQKDFRLMMYISPSKDPKVNYERLQNFNKRMQEIMTDFQ